LMEELRGFPWIDYILHCHEHRPLSEIRFHKCRQFSPMIPGTEIGRNTR
jgi:hypothetical protein